MQTLPTVSLGSGIRYTEVLDDRFRGCLLSLRFALHRDAAAAPVHALLTDLLTAASADYPEIGALTARLDALYAADLSAALTLCGDCTDLHLTATWLDDAFALRGETLTDAVTALVLGCLLRPCTADGAFLPEIFAVCRQNLLDEIDSVCNDKREYALQFASETAFAGEPAAIPPQGFREDAETVTAAQCAAAWSEILRTAPIDIIAVLPAEKPQLRQMLQTALSGLARSPRPVIWESPSPCRREPVTVCEDAVSNQSRLVYVCKYRSADRRAVRLLCKMLSGTGSSLLFAQTREQEGLCYDCSASYSPAKHTVVVECGVQPGNEQAALGSIKAQIAALQHGDFPDSLREEAILSEEYALALTCDSASGIASRLGAAHRLQSDGDPDAERSALHRVTRSTPIAAANALIPDTVLILTGTDAEEADP